MLSLVYGTPVETFKIGKLEIRVKRDDLAHGNDASAPPLGKLRGLLNAIRGSGGARIVGGVDRRPSSRNSWATAYLARGLGLQAHVYFSEIGPHQQRALDLGARYTVLPGLELEELYAAARLKFEEAYWPGEAFMPIDDCQAEELVKDAEHEVLRSDRDKLRDVDAVIIPTGSGGLAMGIMRGFLRLGRRPAIILHAAGSRRSEDYLQGIVDGAGLRKEFPSVRVIGEKGTGVTQVAPPFPCNPTYELPAWNWMLKEFVGRETILFWNAGG